MSAVVLVQVFVCALKFSVVYGKHQTANKTKQGFQTKPCSTNLISARPLNSGAQATEYGFVDQLNNAAWIRVMHSTIHLNSTLFQTSMQTTNFAVLIIVNKDNRTKQCNAHTWRPFSPRIYCNNTNCICCFLSFFNK